EPDDEFDEIFGTGAEFANVHLPSDSVLDAREAGLMANFEEALGNIKLECCAACHEEGFEMKLIEGQCSSCRNDKCDPVKKWSTQNSTQPALEVPACLKGLTDIEEMLISRIKTYMQVRYTSG
ncbi:hypothetical protein DFP72DRAFT_743886, partial [Ephemerocybe angulata]